MVAPQRYINLRSLEPVNVTLFGKGAHSRSSENVGHFSSVLCPPPHCLAVNGVLVCSEFLSGTLKRKDAKLDFDTL